jgi:hypothetical protein
VPALQCILEDGAEPLSSHLASILGFTHAHGHQGFTVHFGSSDLLLHIITSAARILLPLTMQCAALGQAGEN